ncbi:MAG: hypothetical protein II602_04595, partial [Erysipelotrichales bacterium]|nr:hypothetical protein [Erysipelotrichales bacterium]
MNYQMLDEFFQGHSTHAYELFGAHVADNGVTFTVYAPEARSVQVEGDFNGWDGNRNWLTKIDYRGVWEGFIPEAREYQLYKLLIETKDGQWVEKADPYGRYGELRPRFSSIIVDGFKFPWTDKRWCDHRSLNYDKPVNIYEVHAGGWKKDQFGNWYTYNQLTKELIPYVKEKGYTHIEFMPLMNHPFDGSWGYQIAGFYSLTSKYGTVYEFQNFVNEAHKAGIGVIMDFVAVHFASDSYGLCAFDGSKVYEYQNENEKSQWGSFNFDLGKDPVRSFLMSAANYWVNQYHLDGLRMDAVSNMIFWDGNKNRGENNGALEFIRRFNGKLAYEHPGLMLIAEDSSDYPKVTADMYDLIESLNKEGITIIMVSHDIGAAIRYASHILHIGESIFFGTKEEYIESPEGKYKNTYINYLINRVNANKQNEPVEIYMADGLEGEYKGLQSVLDGYVTDVDGLTGIMKSIE